VVPDLASSLLRASYDRPFSLGTSSGKVRAMPKPSDFVVEIAEKVGQLKRASVDFEGKHDPDNLPEYAKHLSEEYKRLNKIVEYQNWAIGALLEGAEDAGTPPPSGRAIQPSAMARIRGAMRPTVGGSFADRLTEAGGCSVTCQSCWFDVDGCAVACTNEIF
jgi:hypothetical protein